MVWLSVLMLILNFGRTSWNLFKVWPEAKEVQFVWQADFTNIATYLENTPDAGPIAIGGWTPDTMDPPTMELLLRRDNLTLRYFDPTQSLILPAAVPNKGIYLAWPTDLPLEPGIQQLVSDRGAAVMTSDSFTVLEFSDFSLPTPQYPTGAVFGDQITFIGYDLLRPIDMLAGGNFLVRSYWRVERPTDESRRFFLHLVDDQGLPIVQQDTLGAPAEHWQAGDIIIQIHSLDIPPTEEATNLLLGIYNPETNERLRTADNVDALSLGSP